MSDVRVIERVTSNLIEAMRPDGSIDPKVLMQISEYNDQELNSIRNCYRVMTGGAKALGAGGNLLVHAQSAAKETGDQKLQILAARLAFLSRNDKKLEGGLLGALHCYAYALSNRREASSIEKTILPDAVVADPEIQFADSRSNDIAPSGRQPRLGS